MSKTRKQQPERRQEQEVEHAPNTAADALTPLHAQYGNAFVQNLLLGGGGPPSGEGAAGASDPEGETAAAGLLRRVAAQASAPLPHLDELQGAFEQDLSVFRAVLGGPAALQALDAAGAEAAAVDGVAIFRDSDPAMPVLTEETTHLIQGEGLGSKGLSDRADAAEKEAKASHARLEAGEPIEVSERPVAAASLSEDEAGAAPEAVREDAAALLAAFTGLGTTEETVYRVLSQPAPHVRAVVALYNAELNSHTGKGLVEDLRYELDEFGWESTWSLVVGMLTRAGIPVPGEEAAYERAGPVDAATDTRIVAEPDLKVLVPETRVTYRLAQPPQWQERGTNTQIRWVALNDPRVSAQRGYSMRQELGSGPAVDTYAGLIGNHVILAQVTVDSPSTGSGTPTWYEFPQTVVPESQLAEESLSAQTRGVDPAKELELAEVFLEVLEEAAKQPGSGELDPKTQEAYQQHIDALKARLASTEGAERFPVRAVHVESESATSTPLKVFVARVGGDDGAETWTLVDITNPTHRSLTGEYEGSGPDAASAISAALSAWDTENRYPTGRIHLEVPTEAAGRPIEHEFQTDGASFWDSVISFFEAVGLVAGVAAIGLGIASAIAPVPGSRAVSALVWTSILASTAAAGMNITQRHAEGFSSPQEDALDVLTIAGNVLAGAWMKGATVLVNGQGGSKIAAGLLIGQIGADGLQGVILSAQFVEQYDQVMAIEDPQRRTDALLELFRSALLTGGMLVLSLKGTKADLEMLGIARSEVDLRRLADPSTTVDLDTLSVNGKKGGPGVDNTAEASGGAWRSALAKRYPKADAAIVDAFVNGLRADKATLKERFNVDLDAIDLDELMRTMAEDPRVVGLDEWLESCAPHFTGKDQTAQRFHHLNELLEARKRMEGLSDGETLSIAEGAIPGTSKTADISIGEGRVEVKTVENPLVQGHEVHKQISRAVEKFMDTNGRGGPYEVVIYASYSEQVLTGIQRGSVLIRTHPDGFIRKTRLDNGAPVGKPEHFFDKLTGGLNSSKELQSGYDALSIITIRMTNGQDHTLVKQNGQWSLQ